MYYVLVLFNFILRDDLWAVFCLFVLCVNKFTIAVVARNAQFVCIWPIALPFPYTMCHCYFTELLLASNTILHATTCSSAHLPLSYNRILIPIVRK